MQILILHQVGRKEITQLQNSLKYENIQSETTSSQNLDWQKFYEKLSHAHVLVLYLKSPDQIEPLKLLPSILKKRRIPVFCLDDCENIETERMAKQYGVLWYFPAPFHFGDVALKLKLHVYRKVPANGEYLVRAGDVVIDLLSHQVKRNHEFIDLRGREFALMEFLMLNRGRILTRNTILEQVWDRNTSLLSNTVDVHISRLRRKFETPEQKYFHTVHSLGYKFEPKNYQMGDIRPSRIKKIKAFIRRKNIVPPLRLEKSMVQ